MFFKHLTNPGEWCIPITSPHKMGQLTKNLSTLNAPQVVDKSKFIEARMKDNPVFPLPEPALAEIAAARTNLEAAMTAAMDGGRTATAIRNARTKELKLLLSQLAGYVASVAEGNTLAILSSGFDVRRTPSPSGELVAPPDLQAEISAFPGRVDLRWKPLKHAVAYQVHLNRTDPADGSAWQLAGICTKAKFKVTGLASGTTTWFRVSAVGTTGVGPVSEVAHSLVN